MQSTISIIVGLTVITGSFMGLMLVAYDDGVPFGLYKKLKCKLGRHTIKKKIGKVRIHRYYCEHCKKPRKHPSLKVIDGGNKIGTFKF